MLSFDAVIVSVYLHVASQSIRWGQRAHLSSCPSPHSHDVISLVNLITPSRYRCVHVWAKPAQDVIIFTNDCSWTPVNCFNPTTYRRDTFIGEALVCLGFSLAPNNSYSGTITYVMIISILHDSNMILLMSGGNLVFPKPFLSYDYFKNILK